jgi:signal transduction histidine kinase
MSRLPIRLRLSLVFALAMAVVLAGVGAFLYVSLRSALDEQLEDNLQVRLDEVAALVQRGAAGDVLPGDDDRFAQLRDRNGDVVAASLGFEPDEPSRVLTREVGELTVVVGESLEDRDEALATLLVLLLLGGPVALVLATLAGYRLAGAALGPVDSMRREAAEISAATTGRRLPVPAARDEIQRLGETLNEMLERLDAGLRRERRFVGDASHELRTPLALLKTELELALRRPREPGELERAILSATEEVERLIRLAEGLLALDRSAEAALRPAELDARELLDAVARRFAARAAEAGRAIEVRGVGTVHGDRDRLEQALGSLVDNALTHGAGAITLEAAGDADSVALRVSDEGEGFPPDFVPHAFERFSRADAARTTGGAGLGLAIVDAVARAHGGRASATGATVSVVLPAHRSLIRGV